MSKLFKKIYNILMEFNIFGDWGLGIGPNPQSPIPNPQYIYFDQLLNYFLQYNSNIKSFCL